MNHHHNLNPNAKKHLKHSYKVTKDSVQISKAIARNQQMSADIALTSSKSKTKDANLSSAGQHLESASSSNMEKIAESDTVYHKLGKLIGLNTQLVDQINRKFGFAQPTPIQLRAIPHALSKQRPDMFIQAQTGSGKTFAFLIPVLDQILRVPKLSRNLGTLCLILSPTRELAIQIFTLVEKLSSVFPHLVAGLLVSGQSRHVEKRRLRKGCSIVVSTPGKCIDHLLNTESFETYNIQFIVFDEADQLVDKGFLPQMKEIVKTLNDRRTSYLVNKTNQTVTDTNIQMFLASATLSEPVKQLLLLQNRKRCFISQNSKLPLPELETLENQTTVVIKSSQDNQLSEKVFIPDTLEHLYLHYHYERKIALLLVFLNKQIQKCQNLARKFKTIIFFSTCDSVEFHYDLFKAPFPTPITADRINAHSQLEPIKSDMKIFHLFGKMDRSLRTKALIEFSKADEAILLATDVAARGLDLPDVDWIIHYEPPASIESYLHRSGRTARIGSAGRSLLFLHENEMQFRTKLSTLGVVVKEFALRQFIGAVYDIIPPPPGQKKHDGISVPLSYFVKRIVSRVEESLELKAKSISAYQSFIRFYATFSYQLKPYFPMQLLHRGKVAAQFGLSEAPKAIGKLMTQAFSETRSRSKDDFVRNQTYASAQQLTTSSSEFAAGDFISSTKKKHVVPSSRTKRNQPDQSIRDQYHRQSQSEIMAMNTHVRKQKARAMLKGPLPKKKRK